MEFTTCVHREQMKTLPNQQESGTCQYCGQEIIYDRAEHKPRVILKKLGRIGDKIVRPKPIVELDLNGKDLADLRLAKINDAVHECAQAPAEETAGEVPPRPTDDPVAQREWYKKYKRQLIEDLLKLGEKVFREKYLAPRQLLSHLKTDKYYKKLAKKAPPAPAAEPKAAKTKPGRPKETASALPQLPAWSEEWTDEIKLAWLEIYTRLIG